MVWLMDVFRIFVKRLFKKSFDITFIRNIKKVMKNQLFFFSFPLKVSKNIS